MKVELERRLDELNPGEAAIIVKVTGRGERMRRMLDMGLVRGVKVTLIRKAPLGDPIELLVKGYNLSLRLDEAREVIVRPVK